MAIRNKKQVNTAPGPDNVRGENSSLWKIFPPILISRITALYTSCLREGRFPTDYKIAQLVFLRKEVTPQGVLPKVRPICLLDEAGKMFERIISRLRSFMERDPMVELAPTL